MILYQDLGLKIPNFGYLLKERRGAYWNRRWGVFQMLEDVDQIREGTDLAA
jgi:hypothetical protein